jgi:hypothetical protein
MWRGRNGVEREVLVLELDVYAPITTNENDSLNQSETILLQHPFIPSITNAILLVVS